MAYAFLRATFAVVRTYGVPKNGYVARRTACATRRGHAALLERDSILLMIVYDPAATPLRLFESSAIRDLSRVLKT